MERYLQPEVWSQTSSLCPVFPRKQVRQKQTFLKILISAIKIFTHEKIF